MPTQVQRRPSEPHGQHVGIGGRDQFGDHQAASAKQQHQQQLQHREALRLALGSILTPKRPPLSTPSRSSSGTASPAYFGFHSGTHTPAGTPPLPAYYPPAHGPNSSENLYMPHPHSHHGPSRLRPSHPTSSNTPSPSGSALSSASNSAHPSPHPAGSNPMNALPFPTDIEPLPPAGVPPHLNGSGEKPVRPPISPLHTKGTADEALLGSETKNAAAGSGCGVGNVTNVSVGVGSQGYNTNSAANQSTSGANTPKSKFLQTLQSKSAWDALIHGSFS